VSERSERERPRAGERLPLLSGLAEAGAVGSAGARAARGPLSLASLAHESFIPLLRPTTSANRGPEPNEAAESSCRNTSAAS